MKPAASGASLSGAGGYALLTDGTTIEIRPARPGDRDAVREMHAAMSPDNTYMRFFNLSPHAAEEEAKRVCRPSDGDHAALLAWLGDELIGVASYEPTGKNGVAEIAFAVADHMHRRGVATLLLEYLVSQARVHQMHAFTAETLATNAAMLKVFADAGLSVRRKMADGTIEFTFPLPTEDAYGNLDSYLNAVQSRESRADVESLRSMLNPASVAVVGVSRTEGTVGRAILHNIRSGGFAGRLYAVNPHARDIEGVTCTASVTELPEPVDLAVIAVPPAAVPGVADECGKRGVKGIVVVTSGLDEQQGAALLSACRHASMRLIGPNCFGVAVPSIGLDATFAARHPVPGKAGLVMQSGGIGFALVDHLSRLGVGVSSFASVGNKFDVSSNDMLMWWEQDSLTRLAILYIESFGNPRKFARTARRVGQQMPVLTVHAGRSAAGQSAAASHTAAVATPFVSREALFEQAGIIATPTLGELLDAVALLASQPVPTGPCVAIVSNVGGAGVLAADACVESGLVVHTSSQRTQRRLRAIVPPGGAVEGPVDTTATISTAGFRECLELVAADDGVDAVLALVLPTAATGDLVQAACGAGLPVPLAAAVLDQPEAVKLLCQASAEGQQLRARDAAGFVPAYAYPESAARALANAATYGAWRARPQGSVPEFGDLRADDAHALVNEFLGQTPDGGWLPPEKVHGLLGFYGVALVDSRHATGEDAAVSAAAELGGHVVLKADVPGLVHKTDAGAVQLDVRTPEDVRAAYADFKARFGERVEGWQGVLIQPMISGGTEVIVGVVQEPVFGPVVVFGLGGVGTEVLGDHVARLTPLTDTDADELIHTIHAAPLLLGHRGSPAADITALREILLRVSRLADDLPEIAELDLNPVIARPDGVFAVDARIRLAHAEPRDPFLRRLP
jgi:acyl-CoA synthetase (NDP forming)/RimJ/RimL family protein N-acetyltransferase